jgi:hypothetical protein
MNCFNNVPCGRSKRVTASGALQQGGEQLIHTLNGRTNFLVEIVPLRLANACFAEEFRICEDGTKRMAKIVGDEGDHSAYGGKRLQQWSIRLHAPQRLTPQ